MRHEMKCTLRSFVENCAPQDDNTLDSACTGEGLACVESGLPRGRALEKLAEDEHRLKPVLPEAYEVVKS